MMKQVVVADLIAINKKNQILLTKRSHYEGEFPDTWSIPGGTVEFWETVQDALCREIKEELNVQISKYEIFNVYTFMLHEDVSVYAIYFIWEISWEIILDYDELSEYKRFDTNNDLLALDFAFNQKNIIKDFLNTRKKT